MTDLFTEGAFAWFEEVLVKQTPGSVTVNQPYTADCLEPIGLTKNWHNTSEYQQKKECRRRSV